MNNLQLIVQCRYREYYFQKKCYPSSLNHNIGLRTDEQRRTKKCSQNKGSVTKRIIRTIFGLVLRGRSVDNMSCILVGATDVASIPSLYVRLASVHFPCDVALHLSSMHYTNMNNHWLSWKALSNSVF